MVLDIAKGKHPLVTLLGLMAASLAILPLLPPIPQDPSYHQFADQRTLLGVPNFWNVVSNLPFVLVGATGLWRFGRDRASFFLFLGVFLTGFGSAYYHWDPSSGSLFWDRLPMALTFMVILTVGVEERVGAKAGAILLWPSPTTCTSDKCAMRQLAGPKILFDFFAPAPLNNNFHRSHYV
jgi:Ceramidase